VHRPPNGASSTKTLATKRRVYQLRGYSKPIHVVIKEAVAAFFGAISQKMVIGDLPLSGSDFNAHHEWFTRSRTAVTASSLSIASLPSNDCPRCVQVHLTICSSVVNLSASKLCGLPCGCIISKDIFLWTNRVAELSQPCSQCHCGSEIHSGVVHLQLCEPATETKTAGKTDSHYRPTRSTWKNNRPLQDNFLRPVPTPMK
jgi:hypothetical protein